VHGLQLEIVCAPDAVLKVPRGQAEALSEVLVGQ
jgi:hypothetical protein